MKKFTLNRELIVDKKAGKESWVYEDPKDKVLFIRASVSVALNLIDFDNWLIGLKSCARKIELIKCRQSALNAATLKLARSHLDFMYVRYTLSTYDEWLDELEPCAVKDDLLKRKKAALETMDFNIALRHLEFIKLSCLYIRRENFLLPLARKGKKADAKAQSEAIEIIIERMRIFKKNGGTLDEFLVSNSTSPEDDLFIFKLKNKTQDPKKQNYLFGYETEAGEEVQFARSISAIGKWWAKCSQ
jgi:hypothetical protein